MRNKGELFDLESELFNLEKILGSGGIPSPGACVFIKMGDREISAYADEELSIPHPRPIIADMNGGLPPMYLPSGQFSYEVKSYEGSPICCGTINTFVNRSGFAPFDTRVLVLPDQVADKIGSILLPEAKKEREAWAMTKATLVAVGDNAFMDWGDTADKPKPGDRVLLAQYAGKQHEGDDGKQYRVCKDEDILARLVEDGA